MKDSAVKNYDFEDVNTTLKEIAKCDTYLTSKEAQMNESINKIKNKFDDETYEFRSRKQMLEQEIEGYCTINKSLFDAARTKTLLFGKVFFRTNPPKVAQLNKKYKIETSIELIKRIFKNKFLRTKQEIDKESILTAYSAKEIDDSKLAAVGLRVDQDEKFGYEINWENLEEK
jgi:phage host-nuclease inhibitor protein Gam